MNLDWLLRSHCGTATTSRGLNEKRGPVLFSVCFFLLYISHASPPPPLPPARCRAPSDPCLHHSCSCFVLLLPKTAAAATDDFTIPRFDKSKKWTFGEHDDDVVVVVVVLVWRYYSLPVWDCIASGFGEPHEDRNGLWLTITISADCFNLQQWATQKWALRIYAG